MTPKSVVAVVVLVVGICAGAYAEDPAILLEKGLYLEETKGDLDAAVEVYEQIVKAAEAGRRYVAEAYYRLGTCYLKMGRQEQASEAFENLIARFPEQEALVAAARKHMPAARFPEFVGARIKETVTLSVKRSQREGRRTQGPQTIHEGSLLEIQWSVPPDIAQETKHFLVGVLSLDAKVDDVDAYLWSAVGVPAATRSTTYGKAWSEEIGFRHPYTRDAKRLAAGEYWVLVLCYRVDVHEFDGNVIGHAMGKLTVKPMPYTQIAINEVQPDGTIRMRNILQDINRSGEELTAVGFVNSDFVHITAMSDGPGRPIEFTAKHENNMYRYNATLNEPVPPGQPVIYASEGTVAGLVKRVSGKKDELRYEMTHWPSSGRPTRRVEVYRLPQGAELLETTPEDMARRTKEGRIELFVEKMVPAGGSITTGFRYRLSGARLAEEAALKLDPAPWADGEVLRLTLNTMAGAEIGTMTFAVESAEVDDMPAWRLKSYLIVSAADTQQFARVDAKRDSFLPITSRTKSGAGDFRAEYAQDKVTLKTEMRGKESTRQIPVDRPVYDNEQALHLIRRLPLAEGYRASFPIFPVQGGMVVEGRIEVTGREKVTVTAGTFDCYKIDLSVYAANVQALQHDIWISADEHKYPVKYDSGNAVMELAEVALMEKDKPATFQDEDLGIFMTAPTGWYFYRNPNPGAYKFVLQMAPPELHAWALFTCAEVGSLAMSVRAIAEGDAEALKGFFKDYTVHPDSWAEPEVSGLPGASFVADYQHKGKDMVEYRTYLLGRSAVYWFVFRIEKDQFEASRPEFDSIVRSFKTKEKPKEEEETSSTALSNKGWQLWAQSKWAEAEETFKEAVSKDASNANAWNGLGWSQFHLLTREDAKSSFRKCLRLDPKHAGALNGLGWIAKGQAKTQEAIGYWKRAVEASPSTTAALSGLATTFMELKQYDGAIQYCEMWLQAEPKNADAKAGLEKAKAELEKQ